MKHMRTMIAAIVAIIIVGVGVAVYTGKLTLPGSGTAEGGSETVTREGGTFTFPSGIVITVPPDAVGQETTLTVSDTSQQSESDAGPFQGLRSGGIAFDVSLVRGDQRDIQPQFPLEISIPLSGKLLPEGTNPSQALLYTANPLGGFLLVPATVNEQNVLKGWLTHLSPKYVSYVDENAFLKAFGVKGTDLARPQDCKSEVSTSSAGKVNIGGNTGGWSNDDKDTPIYACLAADGDTVHLGIANRLNYILSVANTKGVELKTSKGNLDEEMAKAFAQTVFPNRKITGFVGRGGKIDATLKNLPATVQLKADPNTFLAEAGWFALTFTVSVLIGEKSSALAQRVAALLDVPGVVSCLKSTLDISMGNASDFGFWSAIDLVTSDCTGAIIEALGIRPLGWEVFGKWFDTIGSGLSGGWNTIRTALEGARMQFHGLMTVEVVQPAPPFSFVGEWWRYRAGMVIRADGTGEWKWSSGACCYSLLKFTYVQNGENELLATIVSDQKIDTDNGTSTDVNRSDRTIQFVNVGGDRIQFFNDDVAAAPLHWCRDGSAPTDDPNCEQ